MGHLVTDGRQRLEVLSFLLPFGTHAGNTNTRRMAPFQVLRTPEAICLILVMQQQDIDEVTFGDSVPALAGDELSLTL